MRRILFLSLAVSLLLVSCLPVFIGSASTSDIAKKFTLEVDGVSIPAQGDTYAFSTSDYKVEISFDQQFFYYTIENASDQIEKLIFDESVLVGFQGFTSRLLPGNASFMTRNDAQPAQIIPQGAKATGTLLPTTSVTSDGPAYFMIFPPEKAGTLKVILALDVGDERQTIQMNFLGRP